jgi:hypothetical protein
MTDKRMLIVDDELLNKIDENRGDMSRAEFISFLINTQLKEDSIGAVALNNKYIDREEFQEFAQGMKDLLRRFLDFFISYGLELKEEPKDSTFAELVQKLQTLSVNGGKPKTSK